MPEQAPWRFQKVIKPMVDIPKEHVVLGGLVLTCRGDEAIPNGFVEIQDGLIKAVGSVDELGSRESELVDVGGTLLPGLFNSHAHLAWDGVHDLARQSLDDSPEISAYKSAGNMLVSLRSGVTTVRDLGMNTANLHAKQAVEQNIFPGPRLLVTGEAIVQTGGHTYWCCREASGPDEMRRAVRDQVRAGADLIKIMACHDTLEFTDEELTAVIDESHRNGLPITAHATYNDAINRVAQFGIDVVEHGGSMTAETIDLLIAKGIPVVTTFAPVLMQSRPEIARRFDIPEWKIEERQRAVSDTSRYQGLVDAAEAGVTIVFGTDAGSPVVGHDVIAPEMEFMVKLGVVPDNYAALRSATCSAAALSGLENELGTLEAGRRADVIVVDGDPRDDIHAMATVKRTYRDGMRMV
ncbi:MAG: amidohydrolase family protein [Caldilineaceae bacterium SB0665_bin_21]|nr:amidohydrolase family protein [Caldilineaceae bacterium SB0665_bin_21]MYA05120.1 amidohydrolase family protein [Caldilineaceae bacterium SB0664_bin_22]MYC61526.1 amidohydrolase family protein [Caldilineaceae bacterium SB0661_bin_34]